MKIPPASLEAEVEQRRFPKPEIVGSNPTGAIMNRKEIKAKTIDQSNNATSINYKRGMVHRAKRHSHKKLRQLIRNENEIAIVEDLGL